MSDMVFGGLIPYWNSDWTLWAVLVKAPTIDGDGTVFIGNEAP